MTAVVLAIAIVTCGRKPEAGAGSEVPGSRGELSVRELAKGDQGGPAEPQERLVTSAAGLDAVWPGGAPPPSVDFDRERVIVVALGERRTAGYGVEVTAVEETGDTLRVRYVERRPGLGCVAAQVITTPYQVVAVEGRAMAARFERQVETRSC